MSESDFKQKSSANCWQGLKPISNFVLSGCDAQNLDRNWKRRIGGWLTCRIILECRLPVFEMGKAMPASANFLKLKICPADFDNAKAA